MMFPRLFSPVSIGKMKLKNRIMLPAMGTKLANDDRTVSQKLIDYHIARVRGGCGLNMVEVSSVHGPSAPRKFVAACDDKFIPGLKKLAGAIHDAGGKAGIQLWQGGLAAGNDESCQIIVPSDTPISAEITIPAADAALIGEVVRCYGDAARRSAQAGFDCVEIHAAHNYMIHSFLSPYFNHRTDEYGGSFANRIRFPLEVIRTVRENLPPEMPILMRVDAHDDFLEGGMTIEDVIEFCKLARDAGVDAVDVSRGNIVGPGIQFEVPPIDLPRGFNIENAARIRRDTGMFTIGVGRINDPQQAEDILAADKADMVVMGRAQLADPDFCNKASAGEIDDIVRCIGCNQGCFDGFADKKFPHITCLRNPALGKEVEYALKPAITPKTVLIAGGGPAGLDAAVTLKKRGHRPVVLEASGRLGGQFLLAGRAPRKLEMREAAVHMGRRAEKLGVDIRLNTQVTPQVIREMKPDAVFCAIGAVPVMLNVPGADLPFTCDSHDVLDGRAAPSGNVTVIGGGLVGLETAEYLKEKGCMVTILEMLPEVGADLGETRKAAVLSGLDENIKTITGAKCTEIKPGAVVIERNGKKEDIPCDAAVIAVGARSRDYSGLERTCRKLGIPMFVLGDAAKARRALNATAEAAKLARTFDEPKLMERARHTKKVIFLTGASGGMGIEGMKQILTRADRFRLRILVRPSKKNQDIMKEYAGEPGVEIVWGDLDCYSDILRCVKGADFILHVGAFVSPAADDFPEECVRINYGSTLDLIRATKEQPNADDIGFVYVGTVAETGCRMPPIHWGRCGDPVKGSVFDYYAVSKIAAERALAESGLKKWVSLRQTGIMPTKAVLDPILFHQPARNVLEWVTAVESGIMLANICEDWVPDSFWRKFYNVGGGESFRMTYEQHYNDMLSPMGLRMQDIFEPWWLARFNFHGQWYTDSDALNDVLRFRTMTFQQYLSEAHAGMKNMLGNMTAAERVSQIKKVKAENELLARRERGSLWMMEPGNEEWLSAFFGSKAAIAALPRSWDEVDLSTPGKTPTRLNHGYDEDKPIHMLDLADMKGAAEFRGGKCLDSGVGDFYNPIKWRCAFGHDFEASPNLVLKGGHWCPECERRAWNYGEIAGRNPFFDQVWAPLHDGEDAYSIKKLFNDTLVKR